MRVGRWQADKSKGLAGSMLGIVATGVILMTVLWGQFSAHILL